MAAAPKSDNGAPVPEGLSTPIQFPDTDATVRIDADEFARMQSEDHEKERAERDGQAQREVLEQAWREQEEYARSVQELKEKIDRRGLDRARAIALVIVLAAIGVGAFVYNDHLAQERAARAEALRIAAASLARQEDEKRVRAHAEASSQGAVTTPEADPAVAAWTEAAAKQAEQEKAKALALKIEAEAKRMAEQAAKKQAEAMAQAEERARVQAAASVKEVPRAAPRPGTVFQDCADCPRMVVIPAGSFTMGSPASEGERGADEGPQRQVAIAQAFALGRSEVTVAEFRRFVEESGYRTEAEREGRAQGCSGFIEAAALTGGPGAITSWRNPGLLQAEAHPVVCVSWNDARAYAQWLSRKTGRRYRLPTEAEWEYAARAGSVSARYWGDDPVQACRFANVADQSRFEGRGFGQKHDCTDGHYFTAPSGGYAPNRFGLYDMLGNAWEWTDDCWNAGYAGAPADSAAWQAGDCSQRVCRGGSWSTVPRFARSAARHKNSADYRDNLTGFRLARAVE